MRTALGIAVLAAVNMAATFLLQWYVLVFFGPGNETDALFAGLTVPNLVVMLTAAPVGNTLVPLLSQQMEGAPRRQVAWAVFAAITAVFGALTGALLLTVDLWAPALAPGFEGERRDLLLTTSRIQVVSVVFTAQYSVAWAMCQARRAFVAAEVSLLLSLGLSFGALLWAAPRYGVEGVAWVNAGRAVAQTVLLLPAMGWMVRPDLKSPALLEAWRRMWPLLLGGAYYKSDILVDRYLSSMAPAGGLSLFHLGRQLYAAAQGILSKALVGPIVPVLSGQAAKSEWPAFRALYRKRLGLVSALIVGGYAAYVVIGKLLLGLLIGHGGVTAENLETLHAICLGLAGFLLGAPGQILSSGFYALGDTRTPTIASVCGYTIGIGLKVGGFVYGGLVGLAVATSLYYLTNMGLLGVLLERRMARLGAG